MKRKDSGPAGKADLAMVESGLKADLAGLKADLTAVEKRLDAKIDGVEKRLDAKIGGVEKRLDAKIGGVEKSLDAKIGGVALELVKTQDRMEKMEERLTSLIREESGKTTGRIDAFLTRLESYDRKSVTLPNILDQHGLEIRGHEARLGEHDRRLKAVEARR